MEEAFPHSPRDQKIYAVAKVEGENLLTKEVFNEIIEFEEKLWKEFSVENMRFNDVCFKATSSESNESACERNNYPLMFFLKSDASFDRSSLVSTDSLFDKINSGKGTTDFYPEGTSLYISVKEMFGGTDPFTTYENGENNIREAKAMRWTYYISDRFSHDTIDELY